MGKAFGKPGFHTSPIRALSDAAARLGHSWMFRRLCPLDFSCHRVFFLSMYLSMCSPLPPPAASGFQEGTRGRCQLPPLHFISQCRLCPHSKGWALTLPEVMDGDTSVWRRLQNQSSLETNRALYPCYRSDPILSLGHFFFSVLTEPPET